MLDLICIRLDLFDGGAGAAGSSAGATGGGGNNSGGNASAGVGANMNGSQSGTSPVSARRSRSGDTPHSGANEANRRRGPFDNVKFGRQPSAQADTAAQNAVSPAAEENASTAGKSAESSDKKVDPEARRRAYRELMEGEYKDLYQEDTQNIVRQRFKETRELREAHDKQKAVIDILAQKYGIADGDVEKIREAIEKDDDMWSEMAAEAGFEDVAKYRDYVKLQNETKNLRAAEAQRRAAAERAQRVAQEQRFVQQQIAKWTEEGEALKAKYPSFDIAADLQDKSFVGMLRAGVPMEVAYQAKHHSEILSDAVNSARQQTEKNVVDNIRARGSRPQENGTQSQSSFTVRDDPHNLTKAERAEIARRVARGEVIKF